MKPEIFRYTAALFAVIFLVLGILLLAWPSLWANYGWSNQTRYILGGVLILYGIFRAIMVYQGFYRRRQYGDEEHSDTRPRR